MKKPSLNVFVDNQRVGRIDRSDVEADTVLFTYLDNTPQRSAVSLTMPPRADQYDSMGGLLPIFEMNLPEGGLRERLRNQFAKAIPEFDDLDLLAIVGTSQIGRLRFSHEETIKEEVPEQDIQKLLAHRGTEDLFAGLLERFAQYSGISGIQPKVLVREMGEPGKSAHQGSTHIVKSFNPADYPELAANELICSAGASKAGLRVAKAELSKDRRILVVERFDRTSAGSYLGIEDFCVLTGRRSHGRYDGAYEDVAKRITDFVSSKNLAAAREHFALMVAYACAIENGDAHLKNFSVIYSNTEAEIELAPAYDLISTTPYMPRDTLALTLAGSKAFPDRETLLRFVRSVTSKNERAAEKIIDRAIDGAGHAIEVARAFANDQPEASNLCTALQNNIGRGIARLAKRAS